MRYLTQNFPIELHLLCECICNLISYNLLVYSLDTSCSRLTQSRFLRIYLHSKLASLFIIKKTVVVQQWHTFSVCRFLYIVSLTKLTHHLLIVLLFFCFLFFSVSRIFKWHRLSRTEHYLVQWTRNTMKTNTKKKKKSKK